MLHIRPLLSVVIHQKTLYATANATACHVSQSSGRGEGIIPDKTPPHSHKRESQRAHSRVNTAEEPINSDTCQITNEKQITPLSGAASVKAIELPAAYLTAAHTCARECRYPSLSPHF